MPSAMTTRGKKANLSTGDQAAEAAIPKLIKDLQTKYGMAVVMTGDQYDDPARLPTGLPDLDRILGGGWPQGRISELWGPQSAGKSTILLKTVEAVQLAHPKAKIAYFDLENTFSKGWAKKHGVDLKRLWVIKALPAEEVGELILKMIKLKWDLVMVDSLVELLPEKELKKKLEEDSVAVLARVLSKLLPKVVILQSVSPTVFLVVNQVRDDIGSRASFYIGGGSKAPGGQALYHLDSLRLRVQRREFIKDADDKKIGVVVAVKVIKSKVSKEQEEMRVQIIFDQGIVLDGGMKGAKSAPVGGRNAK